MLIRACSSSACRDAKVCRCEGVQMQRCADAKVSTRVHVHMGGYFCFLFLFCITLHLPSQR